MSREIKLLLPSGKEIRAAVQDSGETRPYSARDDIARKLSDIADELRETLSVLAASLESLAPRQPDSVAMEMSVEVGSGGALKILTADVKGGLKVTLKWDNTKPAGGTPPSA